MSECVFCGLDKSSVLYDTRDLWDNVYSICKCASCSAFFLSPMPTDEMMALAYDETYYGSSEKKFKGPVEKVLDYFRGQRAKAFSKLISEGENVLDIGCGNGGFLMQLLKHGKFNLFGSELEGNSAQRAAAHSDINLKIGKLNKIDFPEKSFSLISMIHVFEHLTEPKEMLDNVDYFLKDNGFFVASFPNIDSFQSRFFKGKWLHLDPPRHLFFFSPIEFKKLMKQRGYEVISENYFSPEQNPYGFVQSTLNMFLKKREVLFEHLKGNKVYTSSYSKTSLTFQKLIFAFLMPLGVLLDAFSSVFKKGATVEFIFKKSSGPCC